MKPAPALKNHGAPQAASLPKVAAALKPTGKPVCTALVAGLDHPDKAVAEQASRTLKKISEADNAALYDFRKQLLAAADTAKDVRVRWNLSLILGHLPLQGRDKALAVALLFERLEDPSGLNRTCALQALVDLSTSDPALRRRLKPIFEDFLTHGTPAMKARAKKLKHLG